MSSATISQDAIRSFLRSDPSPPADTTHLPTALPLSFPTPLHELNTLSILHLISTVLSHPKHISYFHVTHTSPTDTATRGVLGLYLSSGEDWGKDNYLSSESWRSGSLSEGLVTSTFGIQVMIEEEHETMKGIKVGKRWDKGSALIEEVMGVVEDMGSKLRGKCLGELVMSTLEASGNTQSPREFATSFCDKAVDFLPALADPYPRPDIPDLLPSAPLRLLQDLSTLQSLSSESDLDLPSIDKLANISPMPLPPLPLLRQGVLQLSESHSTLGDAMTSLTTGDGARTEIPCSMELYLDLMSISVKVCQEISAASSGDSVRHLSMLDVVRVLQSQQEQLDKDGVGVIVPHATAAATGS